MNDPKENIEQQPIVLKGDKFTADLFNKHSRAINALTSGIAPPVQVFRTSPATGDGFQGPQGVGGGGGGMDWYFYLGANQNHIGVQQCSPVGPQVNAERPDELRCWTSRDSITRSNYDASGFQCQASDGSVTYNLLIFPKFVSGDKVLCATTAAQGPQQATLVVVTSRAWCQVS